MIKVAVIGASGYTGQELIKILLSHPDVDITVATSDALKGKTLAQAFPEFAESALLEIEGHDAVTSVDRFDSAFLCLPHTKSMAITPGLIKAGIKVFDLSADFRLKDRVIYEKWYKVEHTAPEHLESAVYGLPEINRDKIATADLVAVPGCYPTSAILALAPVIGEGWIDTGSIIVNSVSGISGAGKNADGDVALAEKEKNFFAYAAPNHRHTPEIEQALSSITGGSVTVTFIPHILPLFRGIYTTVTAKLIKPVARGAALDKFSDFYSDSSFVSVTDGYPQMKWVHGNNNVFIGAQVDERTSTLLITSTLDNLIKGASGQAVQCFNIRYGLKEGAGLGGAG